MKRVSPKVLLIVLVAVGAVVAVPLVQRATHPKPHAGQARYYCPMHPTYTSDRPGDCPICSMKLVKAEEPSTTQQTASFESICYLHNCAKLHEGKPCPMTVVAKPGEKVTCPICGTHIAEAATDTAPAAKKILYWTDPMIPGYRSDKPGKSPMGMDLVPVYEEAHGTGATSAETPQGYAPVLLTPQKQQLIGVTTAPATRQTLAKTLRTVGVIAHDPELYQAQEEFIQAVQAARRAASGPNPEIAEQASQLVDSSKIRLRHLGLSEGMIEEIATWTNPDHRLLLGGAGQYWVYASIYEYELSLVKPGEAVDVQVDAFPQKTFRGMVKAIDRMLDPMTRTTRVRIVLEDPEGVLKPEMYVNVSLHLELGEVLAIPESAVFSTGAQQLVFIDKGQGLFEPRQIALGAKADNFYEVKAGLAEGEVVVTSGNFLIDSESRLKGALQGRGAPARPEADGEGRQPPAAETPQHVH